MLSSKSKENGNKSKEKMLSQFLVCKKNSNSILKEINQQHRKNKTVRNKAEVKLRKI